ATRIILWAHNYHIMTQRLASARSMGTYLRSLYGHRYYALGLTFESGQHQAWSTHVDTSGKFLLKSFVAGNAPEESAEWYLDKAGLDPFLIDFRSTSKTELVSAWLAAPRRVRSHGAQLSDTDTGFADGAYSLGEALDGVLFVKTSTRARPTVRMRDRFSAGTDSDKASGR
ncbi:MAG: erythromycin esterase family protein, partial [bacterium]